MVAIAPQYSRTATGVQTMKNLGCKRKEVIVSLNIRSTSVAMPRAYPQAHSPHGSHTNKEILFTKKKKDPSTPELDSHYPPHVGGYSD